MARVRAWMHLLMTLQTLALTGVLRLGLAAPRVDRGQVQVDLHPLTCSHSEAYKENRCQSVKLGFPWLTLNIPPRTKVQGPGRATARRERDDIKVTKSRMATHL